MLMMFLFPEGQLINMNIERPWLLVGCLALPQLAGLAGSLFTAPNIAGWYAGLAKPWFNPPNWIFAPVWTALFVLMGLSLYLVLRRGWKGKGGRDVRFGGMAFGAQLALNVLWSALFFGMRSPLLGLMEIGILWLAIAATIVLFRRTSKTAAWLMIPYIAWVSFAAFLNYSLYIMNV
jgi:translocator protein